MQQYQLHDSFSEHWLKSINDINDEKEQEFMINIEPKLPLVLEIDYDKVLLWKPNIVAHWLSKCGISEESAMIIKQNNVNGVFLFELDADLLINEMKIEKNDSNKILRYMRALRNKLKYNVDEDDEEIAQISLEIQEYDRQIKQMQQLQYSAKQKFDKLIKSNNDEYTKYKDWELKLKCIELSKKKVPKKDIASQLKKNQSWVKKTSKLKSNQVKKPGGNIIKQIESFNNQILRYNKQIKDKQNEMLEAREKLNQIMNQ